MNPEQADILSMYINDMLAVEKDILHAVKAQADEKNVKFPAVTALAREIAAASQRRVESLEGLALNRENKVGALVKGAVATAAGTLAGLYDMVRKHPVSRFLRDDHVALNLAALSYGMLYTTALAFGDDEVAEPVLEHLNEVTAHVIKITHLIPGVVVAELSESGPLVPEAAEIASEAIEAAWDEGVSEASAAV